MNCPHGSDILWHYISKERQLEVSNQSVGNLLVAEEALVSEYNIAASEETKLDRNLDYKTFSTFTLLHYLDCYWHLIWWQFLSALRVSDSQQRYVRKNRFVCCTLLHLYSNMQPEKTVSKKDRSCVISAKLQLHLSYIQRSRSQVLINHPKLWARKKLCTACFNYQLRSHNLIQQVNDMAEKN